MPDDRKHQFKLGSKLRRKWRKNRFIYTFVYYLTK